MIKYEKSVKLKKDEFVNFFKCSQDKITIRPVDLTDAGHGIVVHDVSVQSKEVHRLYSKKKGDLTTVNVSILIEDYVPISTVDRLFEWLTVPMLITDKKWADLGYVEELRFRVDCNKFNFYTERVFNCDEYYGWDEDNVENCITPVLKQLKEDYEVYEKEYSNLTDSPSYTTLLETRTALGFGKDVTFTFTCNPLLFEEKEEPYVELAILARDYCGEMGDTSEEIDEFLLTEFGIK